MKESGQSSNRHLLTTIVAQVSKPAVSPTSKSAKCRSMLRTPPLEAFAGLETRDTAGLETCATTFSTALRTAAVIACVWLGITSLGRASSSETTNNFGFSGPETYPIDNFIGELRAADLDGDGLTDLIVVNNSRSKITILYNQTGKTNRAAPSRG